MAVPYTFGSATTSIPLSQLDSNFATTITLGNTAIQLGNTVTTLNNMTFANATVSSVSTAITPAQGGTGLTTLTANNVLLGNATSSVAFVAPGTSGNALVSNGTTWTSSAVSGSAATPTALGTVYGKTDNSALTFLGYYAGASTTGTGNTALGYVALQNNTTGSYNTAVGWNAGQACTGSENTFVGVQAGAASTGSYNVAVGKQALQQNTSAGNNTALGFQALYANTTGTPNTAVGRALRAVTSGGQNVGIGDLAGEVLTTGTFNTFIGNNIDASSSSVSNAIVINAAGTKTDKGSTTGYINPGTGGVYQGNNSAAWSVSSDRRLKKNIVDNTEGLNIVSQIRVRNFEYRLPEEVTELDSHCAIEKTGVQLGVIAQELQEVCGDCVKTESTGVMAVDSDNVFWHMVNAIKDLKALNDSLTARILALESK